MEFQMKNLLALLALLTAVAFTACDDCAEADGGTGETTDTCSDGGVGGATTGGTEEDASVGGTEGGTPAGETTPVDCVMPAHNGEMSMPVDGLCAADASECGDGIAFNGDAACSSTGAVCCITAEAIQAVTDETFRPNGDPSLCGSQGGFCVDQTEDGACDIEGRSLESALCPGSADILCCK